METSASVPVGSNDVKQPATATFREMKEDSGKDDDSNSTAVVEPPSSKRPKIGSNENDASVADVTPRDGSASASAEDESSTSTDVSRKNEDDDDDDSEEEEQEQQEQSNIIEQIHHLDSEEVDLEDDEYNSDDAHLYQEILAAARAGRIPLEFLAARGIHFDFDDEPVEYPFDHPPTSIEDVAEFIQSEKCQRIMILAGAGMSVASGIPDFRSSNGLYATLEANRLTATPEQIEEIRSDPSHSLDQHLFMENPLPCLEVNREFILGVRERRWKATLAHRFVELLRTRTRNKEGEGKLVRVYTQNIDGLEDQCEGIGHERRIAVHGSMDEAECAACGASMDFDLFCDKIRTQIKDISGKDPAAPARSSPIVCPSCGAGRVKPSIVLFRSKLPEVFFRNVPKDVKDIDLLLVLGTSLAVAPACSLVMRIPRSSMRVLMNREPVGGNVGLDFEHNDRDYFAEGNCENTALDLMEKLGWLEDLQPLLDRGEFPESSLKLLQERL
mmetsp:Transcript_2331/g.5003  ORF Transcript_2331/g.5003 Transcript_2331/m.5003 type:complete len:500 (+) Transcript_2331:190-1689(+)